MQEIFTRRSVRMFKDQAVEAEMIDKLLRAAMQAPSAMNEQPWEFIVVQDKAMLQKLSETSRYAKPAAGSAVTFVLLGNKDYITVSKGWLHDMGAAAENMLLEAVHLGLGGLWIGVGTREEYAANVSKLFDLPNTLMPFSLISVGYPDGEGNEFVDRYQESRVHYEKW